MVRLTTILLAVGMGVTAFCQSEAVKLGDAVPVDIRVSEVKWQPAGGALIYRREGEKDFGLGVYAPGKFQGKVFVKLPKGATYKINWFEGVPSALVTVRQPVQDAKTKSDKVTIFLLDGETQQARPVFSQVYDAQAVPNITIENSPILKHAIVTFQIGSTFYHRVLCQGRGDLIASADLDRAAKGGFASPIWTVDGTAVFMESELAGKNPLDAKILSIRNAESVAVRNSGDGGKVVTVAQGEGDAKEKLVTYRILGFYRAMPGNGDPVFELVPTNAVLRPVPFRGPWYAEPRKAAPIVPRRTPIIVQFERSNAQDESVWIKRGFDAETPATLVAVHAAGAWLAPRETGIAYIIDGTLFVRSVGGNG